MRERVVVVSRYMYLGGVRSHHEEPGTHWPLLFLVIKKVIVLPRQYAMNLILSAGLMHCILFLILLLMIRSSVL